ncbi:hypothetical protein jhhlp_001617 [Lomentospora prolificans]|uniref:Inheritance of peroxisomes protein 1 n=1 Tax=Lomentospora prolificans TaxID=41688 RepID=A0A2N3NIP6_9PEZI|nr:hypothetical protein jhhlp_001617 [Lomentospora prolificans]
METQTSRFAAPRRVFTAPVPSTRQPSSSSAPGSPGSVETLYNHPNAKIIAFTATARAVPRSPTNGASTEEDQGTLSWSSQLERTIAVGTFRIYRAPGSVAFLNCGSALQPILPKSQCWCIEEDSSKFVLQIRKPQYWRIELPVVDREDRERAFLLREIFDQVLLFEKTRCPFKRSFTVKLPEPPQTPVKKKPWTPVRRSFVPIRASESPETPPTPISVRSLMRPAFYEPKSATSTSPGPIQTPTKSSRYKEAESTTPTVPESSNETDFSDEKLTIEGSPPTTETCKSRASDGSTTVNLETAAQDVLPVSSTSDLDAKEGDGAEGVLDKSYEASQPDAPETTTDDNDPEPTPEPANETLRAETPVKVKQVVSVIEERIAEEPTPPQLGPNTIATPETMLEKPRPGTPTPQAATRASRTIAPDFRSATMKMGVLTPTTPLTAIPRFDTRTPEPVSAYEPLQSLNPHYASEPNMRQTQPPFPENDITTYADATLDKDEAEAPIEAEAPVFEAGFDEVHEGSGQGGNTLTKRKLRRGFAAARSVTAPPHLTLITSPPSKTLPKIDAATTTQDPEEYKDASEKSGTVSPTESSDSFHSVRAWQSPITPPVTSLPDTQNAGPLMFPYPHDNIVMPNHVTHQRDISDLTVTPDTRCTWDAISISSSGASQLSAITAPDHSLDPIEECGKSNASEDGACYTTAMKKDRPALRHRSTASISTNRALSPLPPPATLFSPPQSRALVTAAPPRQQKRTRMDVLRRMPLTIVAKTCEVLLGPPAYLVTLMLQVASKITAGEWRGMVFGLGEGGEKIPVQWDYSDGDGDLDWDSDEDLDFVTPMTGEEEEETREAGSSDDDETKDSKNTSDEDDTGRTLGVD